MEKVNNKYYLVDLVVNFEQPYFIYPIVGQEKNGRIFDVITGYVLEPKDSEKNSIKYSKLRPICKDDAIGFILSLRSKDIKDYCESFYKMDEKISNRVTKGKKVKLRILSSFKKLTK